MKQINGAASIAEALLLYRQHLRQLLYEHGVMSNPGVDDDWIIQQLRQLIVKVGRDGAHETP